MISGMVGADLLQFLGLFEKKYIVSLPRRSDRRRQLQNLLARSGLDFSTLGFTYFLAHEFRDAAGFPANGVRGCFMSHLSVLKLAAAAPTPTMICEDDVQFLASRRQDLQQLADALQEQPWDFVFVGHNQPSPEIASGLTYFGGALNGTHCYLIKPAAAARLANYLEDSLSRPNGHPQGGQIHVDGAINDFRRKHPDLRTLVVNPPLATQFPSRTDLGTEKWFDKVPVLLDLAQVARRMKARNRV
jgi:glycosyl transferase, family 25